MEDNEKGKENILREVNRKIKMRGIRISIITIIICILIGAIAYCFLWGKKTPIDAKCFKDVRIETKLETIHQMDNRELIYNHLKFTINTNLWYAFSNAYFYVENKDDQKSAELYFYISESYMQKLQGQKQNKEMLKTLNQEIQKSDQMENVDQEQLQRLRQELEQGDRSIPSDILLTPELCKTNTGKINEITKVYYLVYDYDHIDQEKFEKAKSNALLLWEK